MLDRSSIHLLTSGDIMSEQSVYYYDAVYSALNTPLSANAEMLYYNAIRYQWCEFTSI